MAESRGGVVALVRSTDDGRSARIRRAALRGSTGRQRPSGADAAGRPEPRRVSQTRMIEALTVDRQYFAHRLWALTFAKLFKRR